MALEWETGDKFLTGINLPMVSNVVIGAFFLVWSLKYFWPPIGFQWADVKRKDKIFAAVDIIILLIMVACALSLIRTGVNKMTVSNQMLFSIGIQIGTAASLCIIVSGGFVALATRRFVDLIISNLNMINHLSLLISSVFMGMYLGLHVYDLNPQMRWEVTVENVVGLFFALLLMSWVYGLLIVSFTHIPSPEDVERKAVSDWFEHKFIALKQKIISSNLYQSIDKMTGNHPKKSVQYVVINHLFAAMIMAFMQILVSSFIKHTSHLMTPQGSTMAPAFLAVINFMVLVSLALILTMIASNIIFHYQKQSRA